MLLKYDIIIFIKISKNPHFRKRNPFKIKALREFWVLNIVNFFIKIIMWADRNEPISIFFLVNFFTEIFHKVDFFGIVCIIDNQKQKPAVLINWISVVWIKNGNHIIPNWMAAVDEQILVTSHYEV